MNAKRLLLLIVLIATLVFPAIGLAADSGQTADIYFFYGEGCPHCEAEKVFLEKIKQQYDTAVNIHYYEIWNNRDNAKLLQDVVAIHPMSLASVPITLIGDRHIIGFRDEASTGQQIINLIEQRQAGQLAACPAKAILDSRPSDPPPVVDTSEIIPCSTDGQSGCPTNVSGATEDTIAIPFFGNKNISSFSLPVLAVVIGLLDGFNPCAMWVLVFLISLLLGIDSPRRRWLIGGIFIVASGAVYFFFMAAWLNVILFLSYLWYIRAAIGLFAVVFGAYNLRDYWRMRKQAAVCKVTSSEERQQKFSRLRAIVSQQNLLIALGGIAALAFAVNLVELACSAGFPAIFTSVLAYSGIPVWQHYAYIALYILFFMIDDIIVFILAMITLQTTSLGDKYAKYSNLIGGLVIFILGLILLLKPGWLLFG